IRSNGGVSAGCNYPAAMQVGNGLVDTATESDCALEDLVKAGMLTKIDYDGAANRYVLASPVAVGVQVSLWFNAAANENVVRISNLPCDVALEVDRKFDSTTAANTPFSQGFVIAQDVANAQIPSCIPANSPGGPVNDPVPVVLIKY
ncbi:MAG: hypothetical protein ABIS45_15325, partial [Burkholderiales bacterium]